GGLDGFDAALSELASSESRTAFFNNRAWFKSHWGARDANGKPAYTDLVAGCMKVLRESGAAPDHAVLAHGHAGTAWNAE
ncbi:MAG: hypothetical protein ABIP44_08855, partial [Pseudoxanthomonas sp.]